MEKTERFRPQLEPTCCPVQHSLQPGVVSHALRQRRRENLCQDPAWVNLVPLLATSPVTRREIRNEAQNFSSETASPAALKVEGRKNSPVSGSQEVQSEAWNQQTN